MDVWRRFLSSKDKVMARRLRRYGRANLKVGTKVYDIFTFWKAKQAQCHRQQPASELRPPILPLSAKLICPWPGATRFYLASLLFLNS